MSKSKEFFYPLDDDASEQLELVVVEKTPERDVSINVFDIISVDMTLPKHKEKKYLN
jgi:hypothetical protein